MHKTACCLKFSFLPVARACESFSQVNELKSTMKRDVHEAVWRIGKRFRCQCAEHPSLPVVPSQDVGRRVSVSVSPRP